MRHHVKSAKRGYFYFDATFGEQPVQSSAKPTPYETKMMSIRPIPGAHYTERPKKPSKQPIPVWKYIQKHGASHFDAMLAAKKLRLTVRGNVTYCEEVN